MRGLKFGPIALNCGGFGPDDYAMRLDKPGARWVKVIFRWGRNAAHLPDGTVDRNAVNLDRSAMRWLFADARQVCVGDAAKAVSRRGIKVMNAGDYAKSLGWRGE